MNTSTVEPGTAGSLTVHLVRHGQTASYDRDAGLTDLGRAQAGGRGAAIAAGLREGDRVAFCYGPTARARETAEAARDALVEGAAARGIVLVDGGIGAEPGFRNVQVWTDEGPCEPTQARQRFDELSAGPGVPPGWVAEAARFWRAHETDDAMTFWLSTPLLWHESPASVAGRMIDTALRYAAEGADGHLVVGTHSGCLRAVVAWADGADPGEPENGDEVVLRVGAGEDVVTVGYAGRTWQARVPLAPLDWSADVLPVR